MTIKSGHERDRGAGEQACGWIMKRALPLLLFSVVVGGLTAFFRAITGFIPGMQGMLYGFLLGWPAGRWLRGDALLLQQPGQRFWLWLNMLCCYMAALGVTLGALYAPPLTTPLQWLGAVMDGRAGEPFLGASLYNPQSGVLRGWGWTLLNLLDVVFLFVFGLIALGVGIDKKTRGRAAGTASAGTPARCRLAKRLFLAQWGIVLLLVTGLAVHGHRPASSPRDPAGWARMAKLAGRYRFEDGRTLLGQAGGEGFFAVSVRSSDSLFIRSEPDGIYGISLTGDGRDFRGTLQRAGSSVPVRVRFSADGEQVTVAGPVYRQGRPAGEVAVEARRSEDQD